MTEEATTPLLKEYTLEEISGHTSEKDCWLILGESGELLVYDVTSFLDDHPGGPEIILDVAGQDATDEFEDIGHSKDARAQLKEFVIGKVKDGIKKDTKKISTNQSVPMNEVKGNNSMPMLILGAIGIVLVAMYLQMK